MVSDQDKKTEVRPTRRWYAQIPRALVSEQIPRGTAVSSEERWGKVIVSAQPGQASPMYIFSLAVEMCQ